MFFIKKQKSTEHLDRCDHLKVIHSIFLACHFHTLILLFPTLHLSRTLPQSVPLNQKLRRQRKIVFDAAQSIMSLNDHETKPNHI